MEGEDSFQWIPAVHFVRTFLGLMGHRLQQEGERGNFGPTLLVFHSIQARESKMVVFINLCRVHLVNLWFLSFCCSLAQKDAAVDCKLQNV